MCGMMRREGKGTGQMIDLTCNAWCIQHRYSPPPPTELQIPATVTTLTPTIRLGATPSGLTSAHLHHPPIFFAGRMPFLPPNQQRPSCTRKGSNMISDSWLSCADCSTLSVEDSTGMTLISTCCTRCPAPSHMISIFDGLKCSRVCL